MHTHTYHRPPATAPRKQSERASKEAYRSNEHRCLFLAVMLLALICDTKKRHMCCVYVVLCLLVDLMHSLCFNQPCMDIDMYALGGATCLTLLV